MSRHEVVEILDDSSEGSLPDEEQQGSKNKAKASTDQKHQEDVEMQQDDEDDDDDKDDEEDEYTVEAIRAKRKGKGGRDEYFIKWEGFAEKENTWEPLENLKCPELISKFNENEQNKMRRRKATRLDASQQPSAKKTRRDTSTSQDSVQGSDDTNIDDLFLEAEDDEELAHRPKGKTVAVSAKSSKTASNKEPQAVAVEQARPKGFERGLELDTILAASEGDDRKLYFFLKWQGCQDLELVEADELEKHASFALCKWYRQRLTWQLGGGDVPPK